MKLEDIRPADCYARAQRLLGEVAAIRTEMGRAEDTRPLAEVADARPREVYFEALATWHKVARLAAEVGAQPPHVTPSLPALRELRPGHVLATIDAVLAQVEAIKQRLQITEHVKDPAIEAARQPSDVLVTLIRVNREVSRSLERPFTPSDVHHTVALASAYASRLGAKGEPARFERRRQPHHCYERLAACHAAIGKLVTKHGETALAMRGKAADVLPGDVYDLASLVLGELAFLHSLTPNVQPLHPFEPIAGGHYLPAHVDQLARTLEAQLATL